MSSSLVPGGASIDLLEAADGVMLTFAAWIPLDSSQAAKLAARLDPGRIHPRQSGS